MANKWQEDERFKRILLKKFSFVRAKEADLKYNSVTGYDGLEVHRLIFFAIEPGSYLIHGLTERRAERPFHGYTVRRYFT